MKHHWVMMTTQQIHVLDDGKGQPEVILDPEPAVSLYGCEICGSTLDSTTFLGECALDTSTPRA